MQINLKGEARNKYSLVNILISYRTILILLLFILVFTAINSIFLNPTNLLNMLKRMSYVAVTAFSMTFVITLGGLDLSVGSTAAIVGVALALQLYHGVPLALAILLCLIIAVALGAVNGVISVKGKIEPFLVTLASMYIYRGIALVLAGGKPIPIVNDSFTNIFGDGTLFNVVPIPVLIMVALFAVTWFLFKKTKYGFYIRSIGGNTEAAKVAGISIDRVKIVTYMFSGAFASVAGLILAALMSSGLPDIASDLALDAIAAVILGGTAIAGGVGRIWGTIGGTLIMATLNSGLSLLGAQYPTQILVKGLVIILAVLLDNVFKFKS